MREREWRQQVTALFEASQGLFAQPLRACREDFFGELGGSHVIPPGGDDRGVPPRVPCRTPIGIGAEPGVGAANPHR